jgi:hypothetical protein
LLGHCLALRLTLLNLCLSLALRALLYLRLALGLPLLDAGLPLNLGAFLDAGLTLNLGAFLDAGLPLNLSAFLTSLALLHRGLALRLGPYLGALLSLDPGTAATGGRLHAHLASATELGGPTAATAAAGLRGMSTAASPALLHGGCFALVALSTTRGGRCRRRDRQCGDACGEQEPGHNETPFVSGVPTKSERAAFLRRVALRRG